MIIDTITTPALTPQNLRVPTSREPLLQPFQKFGTEGFGLLWRDRDAREIYLCAGSAFEFASAKDARKWLMQIDSHTLPFAPRVFAQLAFDSTQTPRDEWSGFAKQRFFLPRITCQIAQNGETEIIEFPAGAIKPELASEGATPNRQNSEGHSGQASWESAVRECLNRISRHQLEKCVLAERDTLVISRSFQLSETLAELAAQNPACTVFALAGQQPNSYFFGATPERLFALQHRQLHVESLAGTRARGTSLETDHSLACELQQSNKDTYEQTLVTNFLESRLKELCERVTVSPVPTVRKLSNVQHLLTTLSGDVRDGVTLNEILNSLHPTPAVCGTPAETALQTIRELESFDRGLYAGAVGWIEADRAEFVVAIRSGLMQGDRIFLYGGAGIVAGSDPAAEYDECLLKMETLRRALA